ncbi:MAG: calcium-binding EGF-like domain-containing protein [Myxococcales bacterium]
MLLTLDPSQPGMSTRCNPDLCSGHGGCDDTSSAPRCICDAGYAGNRCDGCADGYVRHGNLCARDNACFEGVCGGHGSCDDRYGAVECVCGTGFGGSRCEVCASGYHVEGTSCVIDPDCRANTCGGLGPCANSGAGPVCSCQAPATGAHCEACTAGFHPVISGGCAANEVCSPDSCHGHGTCDDTSGIVRCDCSTGYRGASCQECAAGYTPFANGTCALYAQCANPVAAPGSVDFEGVAGFPDLTDNCVEGLAAQPAHVSVMTTGNESLFSCAKSDAYGMDSHHIYVRIGKNAPAVLMFDGTVGSVGFEYGARTDLALDILADDKLVRHLDGAVRSRGTVYLSLYPAITKLTIQASGDGAEMTLAIDDIQYSPPTCE